MDNKNYESNGLNKQNGIAVRIKLVKALFPEMGTHSCGPSCLHARVPPLCLRIPRAHVPVQHFFRVPPCSRIPVSHSYASAYKVLSGMQLPVKM